MPFPVDPALIHRAAGHLGVRLPPSYVGRVDRRNGGELSIGDDDEWQLYPVLDDSDRTRLKRSANHVARETQLARQSTGFPPATVAIASDGGGNHLVLLPSGDQLGNAVYRWDHDTGDVEPLADDLADLCSR